MTTLNKIELLAPAGNLEKLKTALYFGADAIYLSGKSYGLRAFADNFDREQLLEAVNIVHSAGKKIYVTLNIFAHNEDFEGLDDYLIYLESIAVDAVIVSDLGIMSRIKTVAPSLAIHVSTQANTTNKYAAEFYSKMGATRIVLARELTLAEIKEIREFIPSNVEIEAFVHGAMCISYSGRCLLSNYMAHRSSNKGECAQSCRWEYKLTEKTRSDSMTIEQDDKYSYILNSKDMNMVEHIDKLVDAGIVSFKIEGRVKSPYYVASVVSAYRKAIDAYYANPTNYVAPTDVVADLVKAGHRDYCTGFYLGQYDNQCYDTAKPVQTYDFMAVVLSGEGEANSTSQPSQYRVLVEMRNRFKVGEQLEVLSPNSYHNQMAEIISLEDEKGGTVTDARNVQQHLWLTTNVPLTTNDILRKAAK